MYRFVKRFLDIVLAASLLLALFPLFLGIALLLLLTPPGRVFFSQKRIGKSDRVFKIYKFCTLFEVGGPTFSVGGLSPTPVGAVLRAWSLDELPQLWNILKGDMSFVGPRPVVPEETTLLLRRRQLGAGNVRPGLTGLAQVRGRKTLTIEDKARCDAYYCKEMSFFLDCYIVWRTLLCVHCKEKRNNKKTLTNP